MKENVLVKEIEIQEEMVEKNGRKDGVFGKALHAGAVSFGHEASRLKTQVSHAMTDAFADGKREARRVIRRGYNAAEDLVDEAAHRVKHHPIRAVAIAFGVGALFGGMITGIGRKVFKAKACGNE